MKLRAFLLLIGHCLCLAARADAPASVLATAYYILPKTTHEESGYFPLSESLDGASHVRTAKSGHYAFLVALVPAGTCMLRTMGERIAAELPAGRKTIVASSGYSVMNYVGRFGDACVSLDGYPIPILPPIGVEVHARRGAAADAGGRPRRATPILGR